MLAEKAAAEKAAAEKAAGHARVGLELHHHASGDVLRAEGRTPRHIGCGVPDSQTRHRVVRTEYHLPR